MAGIQRTKYCVVGLTGGEEEAECNALVYMIEDCRSTIFPSRFLLGTGKMDEETRKVKEKEFVEKDLVLLNKYLDDHITGDMWLLNKVGGVCGHTFILSKH